MRNFFFYASSAGMGCEFAAAGISPMATITAVLLGSVVALLIGVPVAVNRALDEWERTLLDDEERFFNDVYSTETVRSGD